MSETPDAKPALIFPKKHRHRIKTPTIIQMEAVECGAASLSIVLAHYGRFVPLEELRVACGVTRDGSKASNLCKAARYYGLTAKGYRREPLALAEMQIPLIVFWNFNHFLVVEGFGKDKVYLNDPKSGPRVVTAEEFNLSFTGIVMEFTLTDEFKKGGQRRNLGGALRRRLSQAETALVFIMLISLMLVIPGLVLPTFIRMFIDDYLVQGQDIARPLFIGLTVTIALQTLLTWLQQSYLLRLETNLALRSSSRFFWHVLRLPIQFFHQRMAGEISGRVDINDRVAKLLSGELATTMLGVILVIFYAALMIQYDVWLTVLSIAIALLNVVALRYYSRKRDDANQKRLQEQGKLMGTAMNGLSIIETLKATGAEGDFFARWSGYQAKTIEAEQEMGVLSQQLTAIPPLLQAVNTTAILALGSYQIMQGQMTMGMLVAFQSLMTNFLRPINDLVNLGARLQEVGGDMNKLDDVMRHAIDPYIELSESNEITSIGSESKLAGYLDLINVTFGYNKLAKPLIEDFNLSLKPGARVALVGGSGSGKSTVAKLIAGLYDPWEGEILFDKCPRLEIPRHILVNSLAMVDQDIFMFEGSVYQNLTLWDNTIPISNVIQAAKDAQIHADIASRVGGYDYVVEEAGRNFSGGQRQRMEIARALVQNPSILVLDEATSALDPITEKLIDGALRQRGCTCIIVAHRLSTIRDSDEIIVLEYGKIVQRGTHQDMYKPDTPYFRLLQTELTQERQTKRDMIFEKLMQE